MVRDIYRGRLVDLRLERVRLPNGAEVDLELLRHPGAAAVAAVDDDGRVTLIRQYRHAAGGFIWELPAGVLHGPEERPEACAARELAEETGLLADRLDLLATILPTPGFCDERIHLFLGRGLRRTATAHERDEVITEIVARPLEDAIAMIRRGEIVDGKTVCGLFLAAATVGVDAA